MSKYYTLFLLILCSLAANVQAQDERDENIDTIPDKPVADTSKSAKIDLDETMIKLGMENFSDLPRNTKGIRVMFYNAENLFDLENDSLTNDDDFTPEGVKRWSYKRYMEKLNNIYRVLTAVGGWEMPELVGFCEIENRKVLEDLIKKTPLRAYQYGIVHEQSPDLRGIDVGCIYRKDKFKYISHQAIRVRFPFDTTVRTRDVLYVQGLVLNKDTLHFFVNHWPSRLGGQAKSEPRRMYVAGLVRAKIDSIYEQSPNANIVVIGDLNDYYDNKSVQEVLKAKADTTIVGNKDMFNFMAKLSHNWKLGSHKYQGHWGTLDHIIVSAPLVKYTRLGHLAVTSNGANIFAARFLLEEDKRYLGLQPFRTYAGPRHIGGFSDHLPVYIDLFFRTE